jgi:hypothetical protein
MRQIESNYHEKKATRKSQKASMEAKKAIELQKKIESIETRLKDDKQRLDWTVINLFAIFFFLVVFVEIVVSWEVYFDIMVANLPPAIAKYLTLAAALVIVLGTAVGSHYLAPAFSKQIREYQKIKFTRAGMITEEASEQVSIQTRKDFKTGLFWGVLMLATVSYFSFYRVESLSIINPELSYSFKDYFLAPFFVFLELICGIFLRFIFIKTELKFQLYRTKRIFLKHQNEYLRLSENVIACLKKAKEENSDLKISKNMADILYRHENRAIGESNFFAPVEGKYRELPPQIDKRDTGS